MIFIRGNVGVRTKQVQLRVIMNCGLLVGWLYLNAYLVRRLPTYVVNRTHSAITQRRWINWFHRSHANAPMKTMNAILGTYWGMIICPVFPKDSSSIPRHPLFVRTTTRSRVGTVRWQEIYARAEFNILQSSSVALVVLQLMNTLSY